ncbi:MAG: hypothetical protein M3373_03050 [Gemmatimonadota bacterium]|nr:hypothetical protein [Gemmatimonadota bacterium]
MRYRILGVLGVVAAAACSSPGSEYVGRWAPAVEMGQLGSMTMVGDDTLDIRRDGEMFQVTIDGTAVPAHLTPEGQLKLGGLVPLELSYSKERDSIYLLGVQLNRLE